MSSYKDLLVDQRAFVFVSLVYRLIKHFPSEERYALISQFTRAAVSVIANIAEGQAKPTKKDFLKFLYISSGSLNECECYIDLALELGYITKEQHTYIDEKRREVGYLLSKLIKSMQ